jgi:hypothetical protein
VGRLRRRKAACAAAIDALSLLFATFFVIASRFVAFVSALFHKFA